MRSKSFFLLSVAGVRMPGYCFRMKIHARSNGKFMKRLWRIPVLAMLSMPVLAQNALPDALQQKPVVMGEGWIGFTDVGFMVNAALTLVLAAVLGAVLAYHPKHRQTANSFEQIEAPRVYILYSVIGSLIGIMVVRYGLVVGFVLFGIGGLIRFRTVLRSAAMTGHIIFETLIGLSCGLDLPNVAVLATVFGFGLIYILEASITYRLDIQALHVERYVDAVAEYRSALEAEGCRILNEKKNPDKGRVRFIFCSKHKTPHSRLEQALKSRVPPELRGSMDWELD